MADVVENEEHVVDDCTALRQERGHWEKEVTEAKGEEWKTRGNEKTSARMREMKGMNVGSWEKQKGGVMNGTEKAEIATRKFLAAMEGALREKTGDKLMGEVQGQFGSEDAWMRRQMDLDLDEVVSLIVRECEEEDGINEG